MANKGIHGEQYTVYWYVDDAKISHKDIKVVDDVIKEIKIKFGKMMVNRGRGHNFVGMGIELKDDGTMKICMKEYIKECILTFSETMGKWANTSANYNLFTVGKSEPLSQNKTDKFHHIVAKLLYICKRASIDIYLSVFSLGTRLS